MQSDTQTHISICGLKVTTWKRPFLSISWDLSASLVRNTNLRKSKSIEEYRDCRMAQRPQKKLDAWWKRKRKIIKDHTSSCHVLDHLLLTKLVFKACCSGLDFSDFQTFTGFNLFYYKNLLDVP